jgi:hypothetical protein
MKKLDKFLAENQGWRQTEETRQTITEAQMALRCAHADLSGFITRGSVLAVSEDADINAAKKTIFEIERLVTV